MARKAHWGIGPLLMLPVGAWALGLGDIELKSALNQPLSADISLVSASPEEVGTLKVSLASRETFERYGLDRPRFLSDVTFSVTTDQNGRDIVRVRTIQSVTEPFVTMLVEAVWPRGRLLKEYTVLLDPPVLLPQPQAAAPVQAPTSQQSQSTARIQRPTQQAATPAPQTAPVRSRNPQPQVQPGGGGTYGPVQRNETLWGIAERLRPAGVSMNQMMMSLYEANPQAFGGNINSLRRGAVLTVPDNSQIANRSASSATAEVRRQNTEWRGGAESSEPRLRLVAPDDGGDARATAGSATAGSAAADEVRALQDEVAERDRLLQLKDQQLQDLQEQLAALQDQPDPIADSAGTEESEVSEPATTTDPGVELQSESDLQSDELFADEQPGDEAGEEATSEAADTTPAVTSRPQPSATQVVTTPPEPSLMARIMDLILSPLVLIGVGVVALLGLGLWFVRQRQEATADDITGRWEALEAEADEDDFTREATERLRTQDDDEDNFVVVEQDDRGGTSPNIEPETVAEALDLGTPAQEASPNLVDETLSSQTAINLDQADPVAEADFHMAYGLYDQAADLMTKAIALEPERRDLKLKLLEVFFVWDNKDSFVDAARGLHEEMGPGDADWDKVVIMGKQICPDDSLFTEAVVGDIGGAVDLDLDPGEAPALDFSLEDSGEQLAADLDMDIGARTHTGEEEPTDAGMEALGDPGGEILDIGDQTAAGLEAAMFEPEAGASAHEESELDAMEETMESPTMESPLGLDITSEQPAMDITSEQPAMDITSEHPAMDITSEHVALDDTLETAETPTIESPTIESIGPDSPTMESPTLETPATELPTVEQPALTSGSEQTAEIDLDDLGLDLEGLDESVPATDDDDTASREALSEKAAEDDLLSATGVTQVLESEDLEHIGTEVLGDDEATMMAPAFSDDTVEHTEVLPSDVGVDELSETGTGGARAISLSGNGRDASIDLDLDDLSSALDGGATVERPGPGSETQFSEQVFGAEGVGGLDLDVGSAFDDDDAPTATEQVDSLDAQTMTEVGTKLDLARAYIDMGDPEGARSILEEVLVEGDPGQQQEAQGLIDGL